MNCHLFAAYEHFGKFNKQGKLSKACISVDYDTLCPETTGFYDKESYE